MADIRINVTIKTDPAAVYEAISSQEGLTAWWCKQAIAKPEVGFTNVFTFGTYRNEMKVTELTPAKRIEWTVINSIEEWMGTSVTFDLKEKNGKTLVRFTHAGYKTVSDTFAQCTYDWSKFLASLKLLCETGTGNPSN